MTISFATELLQIAFTIPILAILSLIWHKRQKKSLQLPPGPNGLPFLGIYSQLSNKDLITELDKIHKQYGNLCSFKIGTTLHILVSDYEMLKEMLQQYKFSGRPQNMLINQLTKGCGIFFTEGKVWQCQRQATLHMLRDVGFAKSLTTTLVVHEFNHLLSNDFEKIAQQPEIDHKVLYQLLHTSTRNIIGMLTFGQTFESSDPDFVKFGNIVDTFLKAGFLLSPIFIFPWISRLILPLISRLPQIKHILEDVQFCQDYIMKKIQNRKKMMAKNKNFEASCLCDYYIKQEMKSEMQNDCTSYNDYHLMRICLEFFVAGSETTSKMIEWLLLFMAAYPKVQEKVHAEIEQYLGTMGIIKMENKNQFHYVQAVIDETLRKSGITSLGASHRALEDAVFYEHNIPSDATILPFTYAIHNNPEYFPEPNIYRPERFLNSDNVHVKSPFLMPFMVGHRICPGKSFAMTEIFLAFVMIMQRYKVEFPRKFKQSKINWILKGSFGTTTSANGYKIILHEK